MGAASKLSIPSVVITSGSSGAGYVIYQKNNVCNELKKIISLEKEMGGCTLWFVNSETARNGWHKEDAVHALSLRDGTMKDENGRTVYVDKIRKFNEQLTKNKDSESSKEIYSECSKRKGKILEVYWDNSNEWKKHNQWGINPHRKVIYDLT